VDDKNVNATVAAIHAKKQDLNKSPTWPMSL
jgi:hypothetical protein